MTINKTADDWNTYKLAQKYLRSRCKLTYAIKVNLEFEPLYAINLT